MYKVNKPKKKYGKYVICPGCKERIYLDDSSTIENSEQIKNVKIYYCFCGEEVILEKV